MRLSGLTAALVLTILLSLSALAQPTGALSGPDCLTLGPLKLGMTEDQVEQAIGAPATRFEPQVDEVTGQHTHATSYTCGASLAYLDNPEVAAPGTLLAIILDESCDWQGVGGLKLGMTPSQTRAILAELLDSGASPFDSEGPDAEAVFFPDSRTVLLVRFYQEKVSYIYLGPDLR